jgi:hypothetical protein
MFAANDRHRAPQVATFLAECVRALYRTGERSSAVSITYLAEQRSAKHSPKPPQRSCALLYDNDSDTTDTTIA